MKAGRPDPRRPPMSTSLAWAVVVAASVAILAMVAAPFVPGSARVAVGMTAAFGLVAFSLLAGWAHSSRPARSTIVGDE